MVQGHQIAMKLPQLWSQFETLTSTLESPIVFHLLVTSMVAMEGNLHSMQGMRFSIPKNQCTTLNVGWVLKHEIDPWGWWSRERMLTSKLPKVHDTPMILGVILFQVGGHFQKGFLTLIIQVRSNP